MDENLRFRKIVIWILSLIVFPTILMGQERSINVTGVVIDKTFNDVVPGAHVRVKGTDIATVTGMDGSFAIKVPSRSSVLQISYVGLRTEEVQLTPQTQYPITVYLSEDSELLDEVVVIAYGSQKKELVTSAISSIDTKDLVKNPVSSVTNLLAGSMPGVSSIQHSGQPGADNATIYVRGVGSLSGSQAAPLVLVDGVERGFSQIDPNEIESITVLKDASSTAVFGVRGANGVILVTTRRGRYGTPSINVSSSLTLQQPISLVEQTNSYEYAKFWNMKRMMDGDTNPRQYFTREQIEAYRTGSDPLMYPSIDWMKYIFNDLFLQQKNNINVSGGNDVVNYFVSVSTFHQNGMLKQLPGQPYDNNYKFNRYNYRANIDAKISPTTSMKLGMGGHLSQQQEPRHVVSDSSHDQNPWVMTQLWTVPFAGPGFAGPDNKRTLVDASLLPADVEAFRDGMFVFYGYGYQQRFNTTLNLTLDITQKLDFITKGLSVSLKGAYDNAFSMQKVRQGGQVESQNVRYKSQIESGGTLPATDPDFDKTYVFVPTRTQKTPLSYSERGYGRAQNWYLEGRVNYERTFGDHNVSGLLLYNQSRDYYPGQYSYIPRSYIGLVGRVSYSYKNRYMLDANVGYNGSENFAPGKTRFGLFPAVSTGWIVSSEEFMQDQSFINHLKLRASWGRVGSDRGVGSRFMYMPSTWGGGTGYSFGVNNPNMTPGATMGAPGNEAVTWETADKQNYGFHLKILDNRLSLDFDYFMENRSGILIRPQSTPAIIATQLPNLNIGKVKNSGYEVAFTWDDQVNDDFNYFVNLNTSFARNKIVFMDEVRQEEPYMQQTGGPSGRYTGYYLYERLYQYDDFTKGANGELILKPDLPQPYTKVYPGDAMYADLNGDGIVDGRDKGVQGYSAIPEYTFGLNAGFNWKGLSFTMQWLGATNVTKNYSMEYRIPFTNAGKRGLLRYFYEQSWTEENQLDATLPRPASTSQSWNSENSTLWLQDASYLRLKNVSLSYNMPKMDWMDATGLSSLSVTLSGYNLLTFSPLKYLDPESTANIFGDYPLVKLYSLGLNLTF